MGKSIILSIITALMITSCSSTGVIPMSQDSYFIGKKDGAPGLGVSLTNKAQVYQEATEFCNEKQLEVLTLRETVVPAAPARLGSTELHFKCVQPGGTAQTFTRGEDEVITVNSNISVRSETPKSKDMYTELRKMKDLRDSGIITQEEFETEKKEILSRY